MITAGATAHEHALGAEGWGAPQAEGGAHSRPLDQDVSAPTDRAAAAAERAITFGPFRLLPTRRLLLEADQPVRLGSRALDILIALIERPGELVSKDQLMAQAWPNTFVEEGNLKVQIAGLRRALGDRRGSNRYLATISGRGYRFVEPVTVLDVPPTPEASAERAHNLPTVMARMIDRADTVQALTAQLPHRRFITIVGPGGIGKTTVALAVARGLIGAYEDRVRFIDLAALVDPRLVPSALADALGVQIRSEDPIPGLLAALQAKPMLLVLDNCEHVVEAAAGLAIELLNGAPGVQILATSREPLRAEGEYLHRLPSLESPPRSAGLTAAEALGFPAVRLFVQRAAAILGEFELDDADAPIVAEICRRLDGIPLAIEFAAARIDAFGVRGLAAHVGDPLQLLTGGRRPALPRHQSLRATFDWGHDLLTESERAVLRRLAIFAGSFTLEAARAVAASAGSTAAEVVECVANLVTKSLIWADLGGAVPCYRLLETTRAYALEKLSESGELEEVERRHAEYLRSLVEPTEVGWDMAPAANRWRGVAVGSMPAVRTGLFPPLGHASIGAARTLLPLPARMMPLVGRG
jgi:predicted ATPase/DNA-binding winged helix-turn-helix (wHTH) protein